MRITNTILHALTALAITACNPFGSDSSSLNNDGDCTLTQGYWKNHEEAWPTGSLQLGTNTYTQAELLVILRTPVRGNGLISLSHQLIAAKLNVAAGATGASISATITAADALIGSLKVGTDTLTTTSVSALVDKLAQFNEGAIGPGHCDDNEEPPPDDCDHDDDGDCDCDDTEEEDDCDTGPVCGNGVIETGETCDDGNTTAGDGCSATCTTEVHVCVCGDGVLDAGEACDDGNTTSGDGCSATCTIEEHVCVCGDGIVEAPEACDDGNTTSGDGCSATCTVEPLPVCGNGVVETGETCDDGNTTSGDHCSSTCQTEACPSSCP